MNLDYIASIAEELQVKLFNADYTFLLDSDQRMS